MPDNRLCDDLLRKPVNTEELAAAIERLL